MPEAANDTVEYRITWTTGGFMAAVAVLIDLLQFLAVFLNAVPGLGIIVGFYLTILGYCVFSLWFALERVSFSSGKKAVSKLMTTLTSAVAELIPFIGALPMTTVNVIVITLLSRAEDREEAKERAMREAAHREAALRRHAQIVAANARLEGAAVAAMVAGAVNDAGPAQDEARTA